MRTGTYLHFPLLETSCVSSTVCSHVVSSRFLLVCSSKELRFIFNSTRTFHIFINRNSQNIEQAVLLLKSRCVAFSFLFVITPPPPRPPYFVCFLVSHQIFCYSCFFFMQVFLVNLRRKGLFHWTIIFHSVCLRQVHVYTWWVRDNARLLSWLSFWISFILKQFALLKIDLMSFSNRNETKIHLVHKGIVFISLGPCLWTIWHQITLPFFFHPL